MSETTNVSVTLGYTLNLGNFQSLRIDLGITDFVRNGENTDQALDRVYEFVESKVIQKVEEAKKELED
jgi:methyl coenzyme M reductase subunit D